MHHTDHLVLGLPKPYRKYSAVMEFSQPLTELAVEQPLLIKEAGQKYLAEQGTIFTMCEVTNIEHHRYTISGHLETGLAIDCENQSFKVPKFALKPFITRLFGSQAYKTLIDMPTDNARELCLKGMFDEQGTKEMQLLHNFDNEVFGVASTAYTFIKTIDVAIIAEEMLREHFPEAEFHYLFSKQYGFRGFIYNKQLTDLQEVGDVRKMFFMKNKHSGRDAFQLIPGLERLACTNGMTSKENYPGVRIVHLADDSCDLSADVRRRLTQQVDAINSMFNDLKYSTAITVPFEQAKLFLSRLPKLPQKIETYLQNELKRYITNERIRLYDIQYVLSYVASNILDKKPQWLNHRERTMNLAGNSIDPDLFDRIVKEQQQKEDLLETEEEIHQVEFL